MTDDRHHYGAVERLARTDPAALVESMAGMRSSLLTFIHRSDVVRELCWRSLRGGRTK